MGWKFICRTGLRARILKEAMKTINRVCCENSAPFFVPKKAVY